MATKKWSAGEFINPGDLRQPRTVPPVVTSAIPNASFETGDLTNWTVSNAAITVVNMGASAFDGSYALRHPDGLLGVYEARSDNIVPVEPGQSITGRCRYRRETNVTGRQTMSVVIFWLDGAMADLSQTVVTYSSGGTNVWYDVFATGTAPAGAEYAQLGIYTFQTGTGGTHHQYFDAFSWDYVQPVAQAGLVYKAVQANAGFTAATEPDWPLTLGLTVVDNEVTWEAVLASNVTWEATPILLSGSSEPTFPTDIGATVLDNTVVWKAVSRRVEDENCPNSKVVAIAASKIFAADRDIIKFCATVNPLDWTTRDDAGYLPFGLQTYGSNPVAAMGLYRSNLVAFNSQGFQMWQVDQDPRNMAFLDAVPVGSTYTHSWVPVANDLAGLTAVGIRNVSIAGASTNLQADGVGEMIDTLVKAKIRELESDDDALGLFWPAAGQYWAVFGAEAFVLTINGAKKKSWSRYVFPAEIDNWTLDGNTLVLRAGDKVWEITEDELVDDQVATDFEFEAGSLIGVVFGYADSGTPVGSAFGTPISGGSVGGYAVAECYYDNAQQEFVLTLQGAPMDYVEQISFEGDSGAVTLLGADAKTQDNPGGFRRWIWDLATQAMSSGNTYTVNIANDAGTEFEGVLWWPFLDMGALGVEKMFVGFDLVATAPEGVRVSIGYNQNDNSQRTADYEIDPDTLTGKLVPFPVSGPSFDVRLTFSGNQSWEWQAANMYVQDWRRGS